MARKDSQHGKLIACFHPQSPIVEGYRSLRTNIEFAAAASEVRSLVVTSCTPLEGKTVTSANLAVVEAQAGRRVLLIDADLRKPSIHHLMTLSNRVGLTSVLIGERDLAQAIVRFQVEGLEVLTSGPLPPNPAELLGSERMKALLKRVEEEYDLVILDAPPILPVADAQILSSMVDGVLWVIRVGRVPREAAVKARQLLDLAKARVLGVVLNDKREKSGDGYSYYYPYSYGGEV
ncbi:MAG: CpsD/CapB family tyrosine-protein kinase [Alicyclobacillaceae bacterium]|nr:CpsD/CapB family tyrosine-protein kinase [Alicyclobacillaceae bacterium]